MLFYAIVTNINLDSAIIIYSKNRKFAEIASIKFYANILC